MRGELPLFAILCISVLGTTNPNGPPLSWAVFCLELVKSFFYFLTIPTYFVSFQCFSCNLRERLPLCTFGTDKVANTLGGKVYHNHPLFRWCSSSVNAIFPLGETKVNKGKGISISNHVGPLQIFWLMSSNSSRDQISCLEFFFNPNICTFLI